MNDADNTRFSLDGSNLTILVSPDYETKQEYYINIRATDDDMKTLDKAFVILVNDVDESVAIDNDPTENLSVYPNPVHNSIFVSTGRTNEKYHFELIDLSGNILISGERCGNAEIEVRPYPEGLYYLYIVYNDNISTIKIVKE